MNLEYVDINDLQDAGYNPRTMSDGMMQKLVKGIKEFGMVQPIVVNSITGNVVGGHQRKAAAKLAGLDKVPVYYVELEETKEKALNLALNKITGDWDEDLLQQLISDIVNDVDIDLTGFEASEVDELVAQFEASNLEPQCDEDDVPDVEDNPVSREGDIFILGNHKVFCGECRNPANIENLLDGGHADMSFNDPPYLMDFDGSMKGDGTRSFNGKHDKIKNDKLSKAEGEQFIYDFCSMIRTFTRGAWYVCFYRLGIDDLFVGMKKVNMQWRNLIIWKKNARTLSNSDYKSMYEPIVYGFADDYSPIVYGWTDEHSFYAGKKEVDVWEIALPSLWEIDRTQKNDLHPTMKPVALCERAILNSSKAGQIVLDLFGGSGSTLIACEKTGRHARLSEIEPKYVDVIVRRWQKYTGKKARRVDGKMFDELEVLNV